MRARNLPLKISAHVALVKAGCQHWGHKHGGVLGATPLGAQQVLVAGGTSKMLMNKQLPPPSSEGLHRIPDGEENPRQTSGRAAGCSQFSSLNMFPALIPLPDLGSSLEHVQPQTHR